MAIIASQRRSSLARLSLSVGSIIMVSHLLQRLDPSRGHLHGGRLSSVSRRESLGPDPGDLDLTLEAAQHPQHEVPGGGFGELVLNRREPLLHLALTFDQHGHLPPQELQIDLGQPHLLLHDGAGVTIARPATRLPPNGNDAGCGGMRYTLRGT